MRSLLNVRDTRKLSFTGHTSFDIREHVLVRSPIDTMNARKPFWQKSNLIHQRPHASKKPYECEEYKNVFYSESSLTLQQRTHTREKPYQCRECWKAFYSKSKLLQHQQHIQVRILNYVNNTEKVLYRSCFSLEIRFHSKGKTQECE